MNCLTMSTVASVDRLSTTITSWGITVCRVAFVRQSAMRSSSFHAGMTIDTVSMLSRISKDVYSAAPAPDATLADNCRRFVSPM